MLSTNIEANKKKIEARDKTIADLNEQVTAMNQDLNQLQDLEGHL